MDFGYLHTYLFSISRRKSLQFFSFGHEGEKLMCENLHTIKQRYITKVLQWYT